MAAVLDRSDRGRNDIRRPRRSAAAVAAVVTLEALRDDSTDRTRPVVIADLTRNPLVDQRMRSVGATPATELRVVFKPDPLIDPADKRERRHTESLVQRYVEPVTQLAPGAALSNAYWRLDPQKEDTNIYPLPDELEVSVTYNDLRGRHTYADTFHLTVATLGRKPTANLATPTCRSG